MEIDRENFGIKGLKAMALHYLGPVRHDELMTQIPQHITRQELIEIQFMCSTANGSERFPLDSPGTQIVISFLGAWGCLHYHGLYPHREYFFHNDVFYERMTMKDLGKRAKCGFRRIIDGRLSYALRVVQPKHPDELIEALGALVR